MKKSTINTLAAFLCCILFTITVMAQRATLESVLPAQVVKGMPGMRADITFLLDKVQAVNPGFKNTQTVKANFNEALAQLKKQKRTYSKLTYPEVSATSYDQLLAAKTKQLGAESPVVKILTGFKTGVAKVATIGDIETVMVNLIKSPAFEKLSATDKASFYNAFAMAKITLDYGIQKKLVAFDNDGEPPVRGVGGYIRGYDDDYEFYLPKGSGCHWLCTVGGGVLGFAVGGPIGAAAGAALGFGIGAMGCY